MTDLVLVLQIRLADFLYIITQPYQQKSNPSELWIQKTQDPTVVIVTNWILSATKFIVKHI